MNNPGQLVQAIVGMIRQGGGNPKAFAQSLLQNNPQFAQMIRGQNVQKMAEEAMRNAGIRPEMLSGFLRRK